jgi:hypothetical protein
VPDRERGCGPALVFELNLRLIICLCVISSLREKVANHKIGSVRPFAPIYERVSEDQEAGAAKEVQLPLLKEY